MKRSVTGLRRVCCARKTILSFPTITLWRWSGWCVWRRAWGRIPSCTQNSFLDRWPSLQKQRTRRDSIWAAGWDCSKVWYVSLNIVYEIEVVLSGVERNGGCSEDRSTERAVASLAVICKFRERVVSFCADMKKTFYELRIREEDKRARIFLFRIN